jgi:hypothetical protein
MAGSWGLGATASGAGGSSASISGRTKLCPQEAQNLPGFVSALHAGQVIRLAKEQPHSLQNFAPSLFSILHVGHLMLIKIP